MVCVVYTLRGATSFIATKGGEQAAPRGETNSQEMNRTDSYSFPTQANISAFV
jgi:hypothetical protein